MPLRRKQPRPRQGFRRLFIESLEDRKLLSLTPGVWSPLGPAPISTTTGPVSGRVTALAADPTNANTIFAGAAGGGVWKTTDGGTTWAAMTDAQSTLSTGAIAIAPSNHNVIYVGTGEANFTSALPDSSYGRGVLKSTDGGATWTLLGSTQFDRRSISKIVVSPTDANTLYLTVGTPGTNGLANTAGAAGVWRSTNGGVNWTNTTTSISSTVPYSDLVIDPTNPLVLFAAIQSTATGGVYKTTDGGTTWTDAGNFPNRLSTYGRISLAISASSPQEVFASVANTSGSLIKIMRSLDGGTTWGAFLPSGTLPSFLGTQGNNANVIAVNPTNPNVVFAGGAGTSSFIESTDAGLTWTNIATGLTAPHTGHHALAFNASGVLLDGNDGGVWKLSDPTVASPVWTDLNTNLNITQFGGFALDPSSSTLAYASSADKNTEIFSGPLAWNASDPAGGGGYVRFDPTPASPAIYHTSSGISISKSTDGGGTWGIVSGGIGSPAPVRASTYAPFIIDSANPQRLLFATNRIWESTNGGNSWSALNNISGTLNGWTSTLAIDSIGIIPGDNNTIYAAVGQTIFFSSNHGANWSVRSSIPGVSGGIEQILVNPGNSQNAYIVHSQFGGGRVFVTTNGGNGGTNPWTDISGNLPNVPVNAIAADYSAGSTPILYVGTDVGTYVSYNGGGNWSVLGTGSPNVQVVGLELNTSLNILAAGTHGRGLWEYSTANQAPSFTNGSNIVVSRNSGVFSSPWATNISAGPPNENAQSLTFTLTNTANTLFSQQPALSSDGKLTFTLAPNTTGTATVSVQLQDNGGTVNGGIDTSIVHTFTISVVNPNINQAPSFTKGPDIQTTPSSAAYSGAWATNISAGPVNEASQVLNFIVTNDNNPLFSVQPAITAAGVLSYTVTAGMTGTATVSVQIHDNGGIADGGVDTSAVQTFVLTVAPNVAPSFVKGPDVELTANAPAYSSAWATAISPGPEVAQTVTFVVTNDNNSLFAVQPSITAAGVLSFTLGLNKTGNATLSVKLQDSGGTLLGGQDTSATQTFIISVPSPFSLSLDGKTLTATGSAQDSLSVTFPGSTGFFQLGWNTFVQSFAKGSITSVLLNGQSNLTNVAINTDGNGNTVNVSPNSAHVIAQGFTVDASNAFSIQVVGKTGDTVNLYDTTGDDVAIATPTYTSLKGTGYSNQAISPGSIYAFSSGGNDAGYLYASSSSAVFLSTPTYTSSRGPGYFTEFVGILTVYANSSAGGTAYWYGTPAYDSFVATPTYAYLRGTVNYAQTAGFTSLHVYASAGNDGAYFYLWPGVNTLTSTTTYTRVVGSPYTFEVFGFTTINAYGASRADGASLYDSSGNDAFTGVSGNATLIRPTSQVRLFNFGTVSTYHSKGTDTKHTSALDYVYKSIGLWKGI